MWQKSVNWKTTEMHFKPSCIIFYQCLTPNGSLCFITWCIHFNYCNVVLRKAWPDLKCLVFFSIIHNLHAPQQKQHDTDGIKITLLKIKSKVYWWPQSFKSESALSVIWEVQFSKLKDPQVLVLWKSTYQNFARPNIELKMSSTSYLWHWYITR